MKALIGSAVALIGTSAVGFAIGSVLFRWIVGIPRSLEVPRPETGNSPTRGEGDG